MNALLLYVICSISRGFQLPGQRQLYDHRGKGGEWLGWVELPRRYGREELARIRSADRRIRSNSRALVIIGVGSFLCSLV